MKLASGTVHPAAYARVCHTPTAGAWTVCEQNRLLALCFGLPEVNKA